MIARGLRIYQAAKYATAIIKYAVTLIEVDTTRVSICIRNQANGTRYHIESLISSFGSVKYLDESAIPQILIITRITKSRTVNVVPEKKPETTVILSLYDNT